MAKIKKEPDVLPGRFPNLLVNGASGIAVGLATNIPTHNLEEVINGVVAYIDNPAIPLEEMMEHIPCPLTSVLPILKSCAIRTIASYTELSPWGWNLPIQSPTIRALFLCGLSGVSPISCMVYKIRRCTGFKPSSTRGKARSRITNSAYGNMEVCNTLSSGSTNNCPVGSIISGSFLVLAIVVLLLLRLFYLFHKRIALVKVRVFC